jgi:hypothetical protein
MPNLLKSDILNVIEIKNDARAQVIHAREKVENMKLQDKRKLIEELFGKAS